MGRALMVHVLLDVLLFSGQIIMASEEGLFKVEVITSPLKIKKAGRVIELSLRGFVDKDGGKISEKILKERYCCPQNKEAHNNECVLYIYFHHSDKESISLTYLFKHIDMIRQIRDKKSNMHVYIFTK